MANVNNSNNGDGGLFELIVDGVVVSSVDNGSIIANGFERGVLSGTAQLGLGIHEIRVQMTRRFLIGPDLRQYVDNVSASFEASAVPVPAALPLFLTSFVGMGIIARRRRKNI